MTMTSKEAAIDTVPGEPMPLSDETTPDRARKPIVARMQCSPGEARLRLPYPNGWFVACFSHEVARGAVVTKPLMDQDIVLYRTRSGVARAIEPYCPHMGAHLGHGGRVEGDDLVCPFHGLAFAPEGGCVRTGDGGPVPRMALTARHMRERNGVIFVWVHHEGLAPSWEPPTHDVSGWSPPAYVHHKEGGYVQSSGENSVDGVHFAAVHKFHRPELSAQIVNNELVVDMSTRLMGRPVFLHLTNYDASSLYGHFTVPSLGVEAGVQGYATPEAPFRWSLRMVTALKVERFGRLPSVFRSALYMLIAPMARIWADRVSNQDSPIWNHRGYQARPKVIASDRAFVLYQRWVSQFYSCDFPPTRHSVSNGPREQSMRQRGPTPPTPTPTSADANVTGRTSSSSSD